MNYALMLNPSIIRPLVFRWKFSLKTFWVFNFTTIIFLIGFYIFQVNEVTQASFFMANYEKQVAQLNQESKGLESNFSGLSSPSTLEGLLVSANYEKVDKVYYIQMLESVAAAK